MKLPRTAAARTYSGPPADRMTGRPSRRRAQAAAPSAKQAAAPARPAGVSAQTETRVNSFLEREDLLDRAIHAGVINAGMRAHYAQAYDADPAYCRQFLGKLGLRGEAQSSDDGYGGLLTPAEQERVAAAREGKRPRFISGG